MAETFQPGTPTKPAAATPTTLYTAPGGVNYALVLSLIAANNAGVAGADDTVTIRKIADGGLPGDADTEILDELPVKVQESLLFAEKLILGANESISVESANGTVVFTVSMLESTP